MANKSISQLTAAVAVNNDDLFETAQVDAESPSGYTSAKHSMAAIADHIAAGVVFPELETTARTLIGAINEAAQTGGGGTTVIANPAGAATDMLDTVQIGETVYDIEGNAIEYEEYTIAALTNGTIDTSRGGCWYAVYGNVVHLHLSVKDLTADTTTNVFTMPAGLRPPHITCMGIGIGADRTTAASVSVGAASGACNLFSESTSAVVDVEWLIDASGSGSGGGSSVNYSTTEHAVGTWIDGSTVYEKTVVLENVNYATANVNYTVMQIPNIAVPVSLTAIFSNSGKTIYHSSPYVATDAQAKKSYFDFDMTNKLIFFISQDTWGSTNMIITARYTKTA